ncbi:hypothetical protein FRC98_03335 [Lujinxingia vulgaris]|uniref:Uncharacterized protein n=1 Tax=Lujinxingia vulgaris TaxID=2600176 RepID=A0A5C6XPA7_9DELT|nr:hypothetical protein [Lujinxingia vulgaris]TXD39442.1 hypothetical protein FRC98_03335 [Lujinxingia vulgaris]
MFVRPALCHAAPLRLTAALFAALLALPQASAQEAPASDDDALPQQTSPPGDDVAEDANAEDVIASRARAEDCELVASLMLEQGPVLACADQRVLVVREGSMEVRRAAGPIEALLPAEDDVWVITRRQEATLLSGLPLPSGPTTSPEGPAAPRPSAPSPSTPTSEVVATVVESHHGSVIVDMGSAQGLQPGQHLELYEVKSVRLGDTSESTERVRTLAIAPIQSLSENRAELNLGINERVPTGALARPTPQESTTSRLTPPRLPGLARLSFTLRPFLALGTVGAGSLSEASAAYQFEGPWTAELLIDPLAVGFSRAANLLAVIGTAIISYDTTPFQVGIGFGTTTINSTAYQSGGSDTGGFGAELGFAISQKVRLGALDGIHVQLVNNFFLYDGAFRYGGTAGGAQVPAGSIGKSSWIVARGGAGFAGHAFGEVGLKVLARGNGDHGSLFFVPTVGLAQLRGTREVDCGSGPELPSGEPAPTGDQRCYVEVSQGGPMIGFQIEWRP